MGANSLNRVIGWAAMLSLLGPALGLLFGSTVSKLLLIIWPSSILLLSLGSGPNLFSEIGIVLALSIGINLILYVVLGMVGYYFWKLTGR